MKIKEAIDRTYFLRPDSFSADEKVAWLNELDHQLYLETILTHENTNTEAPLFPYTADNMERELLIPSPYDKVYISYLKAKIEEAYGEVDSYNNAVAMFQQQMGEFKRYWHRNNMPI